MYTLVLFGGILYMVIWGTTILDNLHHVVIWSKSATLLVTITYPFPSLHELESMIFLFTFGWICDSSLEGTPPKTNGWNLKMMAPKRIFSLPGIHLKFQDVLRDLRYLCPFCPTKRSMCPGVNADRNMIAAWLFFPEVCPWYRHV